MRCKNCDVKTWCKNTMQKDDARTWCKNAMQKGDAKKRCKNKIQKGDAKTWCKNAMQKGDAKGWCKKVMRKCDAEMRCKKVFEFHIILINKNQSINNLNELEYFIFRCFQYFYNPWILMSIWYVFIEEYVNIFESSMINGCNICIKHLR